MKKSLLIKLFALCTLLHAPGSLLHAQFDTLKIMYHNILNYPGGDPGREDYFRTINQYLKADVILINELTGNSGAVTLLNDALNVYGTTHYQKAAFTDGPDTDNMLFYNSDKLALFSQWYIPTALRHINEYVLYYKSDDLALGGDTIFFYFYSAHLKAFPGDSLQRLAEVNAFLARINNIPNAENIFFGGDFNLYTSSDPAYQALINNEPYNLNDPLPAGDWHDAGYSYRWYHTQSTRTASFGGGSTGGLDDRFDFILFSDDVQNGSNRVEYINNSCKAFGNDGNHYNDALIDPPTNPDFPDSVIQALYYMSDHLPVICDLKVEATIDTTLADIVITEIMYNPPETNTDSLEFIELYNNGSDVENLGGYYFSAGVVFTFPSYVINPGEFIVVAVNSEAMMNTFGINTLEWPDSIQYNGLSNSGELIELKDYSGNIIDFVQYDDVSPWPTEPDGNGPSLILCDPDSDNSLAENWMASLNFVTKNNIGDSIYATPGFTECTFPPIAGFSADQTEIFTGESVNFTDLSLNDPTSWQWTFESGTPATSTGQNPTVVYNTTGTFDVTLVVTNEGGSGTATYTDYIIVNDNSPVLVIAEILQNPGVVYDDKGEWFEVFNPTNSDIDMSGWIIMDNDYDSIKVLASVIVPAGGFAVLGNNDDPITNGGYTCNYEYQYADFQLANNGGDEIVLFLPDGLTEVDRIEYDGGSNWPDPNGYSMIFTGTATENNNNFTNWTTASLREPTFTGTSGDKGSPGTNGTGQDLVEEGFELAIKVFLEGPFNGTDMNIGLIAHPDFPLNQPYNTTPWNYSGTESVTSLPSGNIVDWVLVELRDASDVGSATNETMIARQAAFLINDGSVVGLNGSDNLLFSNSIIQQLFTVVYHRNHIPIISEYPLIKTSGVYSYDFTSGENQVHGGILEHKELSSGVWGMIAGDADASDVVDLDDKTIYWEPSAGTNGYKGSDLNLDTETDNKDKDDFLVPNIGKGSQVPDNLKF